MNLLKASIPSLALVNSLYAITINDASSYDLTNIETHNMLTGTKFIAKNWDNAVDTFACFYLRGESFYQDTAKPIVFPFYFYNNSLPNSYMFIKGFKSGLFPPQLAGGGYVTTTTTTTTLYPGVRVVGA